MASTYDAAEKAAARSRSAVVRALAVRSARGRGVTAGARTAHR
ncbi:hypothetical protein SUDANB66_05448 [Streptomyces sp. SudanB66_2053]